MGLPKRTFLGGTNHNLRKSCEKVSSRSSLQKVWENGFHYSLSNYSFSVWAEVDVWIPEGAHALAHSAPVKPQVEAGHRKSATVSFPNWLCLVVPNFLHSLHQPSCICREMHRNDSDTENIPFLTSHLDTSTFPLEIQAVAVPCNVLINWLRPLKDTLVGRKQTFYCNCLKLPQTCKICATVLFPIYPTYNLWHKAIGILWLHSCIVWCGLLQTCFTLTLPSSPQLQDMVFSTT